MHPAPSKNLSAISASFAVYYSTAKSAEPAKSAEGFCKDYLFNVPQSSYRFGFNIKARLFYLNGESSFHNRLMKKNRDGICYGDAET